MKEKWVMSSTLIQNKTTSLAWLGAWVIASAIGITIGFLGALPLLWSISESATAAIPKLLAQSLGGAFFGLGVGLATGGAQWLVLRLRGEKNTRWLVGSVISGILGGIVAI